ncbi:MULTISPECIES: sulfite oxidase heme-binding subunit YedZ [unclassified Methylophaga]|jgi:sulfoxide reductase heme-binding subunit YedZ|uniref:sulfite oxidase heme-binding subunit YedZ n=1 Tax=unclassified Methylophaga TaxID=2629249 RepID=UPI00259C9C0E|nr:MULTISPECIES: protein-methionine-sulfoxide reductase heme-binding subunit MsrQ [unclassified Methylophaga]|tara:strand:- start:10578 stop:11186 length:609 start_codon:yes stop_codon:yes gene_type:complete
MSAKNKASMVKAGVFFICLVPLIYLIWGLFTENLGANPVETLTRNSGLWALRFLLITLLVSPIRWYTGLTAVVKYRRMLGLYAFFYAFVHMLLYLGLDQLFNIHDIWKDIIKRPFITVGFISFILLLPLVVTSTNKMIKRLGGKRWKRLHRLTYLVASLSCLHFLMLVKADIREPVIYILLLLALFFVRFLHSFNKKKLVTR